MKYQPFAFWIFALICGILLQNKFNFNANLIYYATAVSATLLLISFWIPRLKKFYIFPALILLTLFGALRFSQYNKHVFDLPEIWAEKQLLELTIQEKLKSSELYSKYIAAIKSTENESLNDYKVLVYVRKSQPILHQNDECWTFAKIQQIPGPKNPHQFDYQKYMLRNKVGFQIFTDTVAGVFHPESLNFNHSIASFKDEIKQRLEKYGFSEESKVFISALALGDRSDLNSDFQKKLSSAGVMHLFAISGLHVGMVFAFVMLIFYPILFFKNGKYIRIIMALIIIWWYAWFVGFTPSVSRAAFMITVYYTTILLRRPTNIFHTLALSGFILLLINPNQLFHVGFQLSYSAVFFIAWLFPVVRKIFPYHVKPWRNYPYDLLSVTTVAQMGVLPISIYYFKTFSGVFLLGNLVLLPFAGIMIIASAVSVLLMSFSLMPSFLVRWLNGAFELIFNYLDVITSVDSLIFRGVSLNLWQVGILLLILIWIRYALLKFRIYKLTPLLILFFIFQISRFYEQIEFSNKRELIVFQEYKGSVIGIRDGRKMDVFMQVEDSIKTMEFTINPYVINEQIKELRVFGLKDSVANEFYVKKGNLIHYHQENYGIIEGRNDTVPQVDHLIWRRINANSTFPTSVKNIIADGSNYPNVIEKLRNDSIEIYSTAQSGAFLKSVQ